MFKTIPYILTAIVFALVLIPSAQAKVEVGQPAPDFSGADIMTGKDFKLSDNKGKIVVLEWTNNECPFVIKHYDTGNMQKTQKDAAAQGVTWVTIVSSAPGRQGHLSPEDSKKIAEEAGATISAKLLDESGEIGKLYGAQTTPHMFVINGEGTLVYAGAIDDNPSPRPSTVEGANNYVLAALNSLKAGEPVATPVSAPYGCSVKYDY